MNQPTLYQSYEPAQIKTLLSAGSSPQSLCDGQWLIFSRAVAGLITIGDPPQTSRFENGSQFCWAADKPYRVRRNKDFGFVPNEVVGKHATRPIHLFVRTDEAESYLYVGQLEPSHSYGITHGGRGANFGEALFKLTPTLPSAIYQQLGGYTPGNTNHAALNDALATLADETSTTDRLNVLKQVVEYWHGPISPNDGYSDEDLQGLKIPDSLRWWFRWAGRREQIMTGQNTLLKPSQAEMKDGLLVFYAENQWCYEWATLAEGDDPPVFGRVDDHDPWQPEGLRLSEHLILACLFEAIMCHARYGASNSWLPQDQINEIIRHVPPLPLNPWGWLGETRFYARGGAFMFTMEYESEGTSGGSVNIGTKSEHPLAFLKPMVDDSWDHLAL